ncbi:MAG: threonine/serine exporter family protein [Rikenellaceae bacterium]|nr:threonine/serine exporter family protein [Rikenellaceae bacterium]
MVIEILRDAFLSFFVAVGFALLFETPRRALPVAGFLGGMGHCLRYALLQSGYGLVSATLCGAVAIGLAGIVFAHRINHPPVVFTIPACITMIPGLYAYRTMLASIKVYSAGSGSDTSAVIQEMIYNFILTSSLLLCLAVGICIAALLFRKKSVKDIRKIKDILK